MNIERMVEAGDEYAQLYFGWMYKNRHVVDKDYSIAEKWCRKSAEQGHSTAQNNFAHMYQMDIASIKMKG